MLSLAIQGSASASSSPTTRQAREKKLVPYCTYNPKEVLGLLGLENKERWLLLKVHFINVLILLSLILVSQGHGSKHAKCTEISSNQKLDEVYSHTTGCCDLRGKDCPFHQLQHCYKVSSDEIAAQGLTQQLSVCQQLRAVSSYAQSSQ